MTMYQNSEGQHVDTSSHEGTLHPNDPHKPLQHTHTQTDTHTHTHTHTHTPMNSLVSEYGALKVNMSMKYFLEAAKAQNLFEYQHFLTGTRIMKETHTQSGLSNDMSCEDIWEHDT